MGMLLTILVGMPLAYWLTISLSRDDEFWNKPVTKNEKPKRDKDVETTKED